MEKKDFNAAIAYLETYLKKDPANSMANNNLLLLYLDSNQPEKAKAHIKDMQKAGLNVSKEFLQRAGM
jgi:DNA-binding SARP family transcriptional activator